MKRYPVFSPVSIEEFESQIDSLEGIPVVLAGGTDVFIYARSGLLPEDTVLVDISRLDILRGITEENGHIRIGAMVTHEEVANNSLVKKYASALAEGCRAVGCLQIRNRGTIGGNLCNASPCGDSFAPLVVLNAGLVVRRQGESRQLACHEFFTGPKKTVLARDELLTHVLVPKRSGYDSFYAWLGQRKSQAITKVSAALGGVLEGGIVKEARIALGAVGPTVLEATQSEAVLKGRDLDDTVIEEACRKATLDSKPICDLRSTIEYRAQMCGELLRTCLLRWKNPSSNL